MLDYGPIVPYKDGMDRRLYEILRRLQNQMAQSTSGFSAILRGEVPDGSGNPLVNLNDYFYLPGRRGGQLGHGATEAGGDLTLSSTRSSAKGHIYFGSARMSAFDEPNESLGIGTSEPGAALHVVGTPSITTFAPNSTIAAPFTWQCNGAGIFQDALAVDDGETYVVYRDGMISGSYVFTVGLDGALSGSEDSFTITLIARRSDILPTNTTVRFVVCRDNGDYAETTDFVVQNTFSLSYAEYQLEVTGPWTPGNGTLSQTPNSVSGVQVMPSSGIPGYFAITYLRVSPGAGTLGNPVTRFELGGPASGTFSEWVDDDDNAIVHINVNGTMTFDLVSDATAITIGVPSSATSNQLVIETHAGTDLLTVGPTGAVAITPSGAVTALTLQAGASSTTTLSVLDTNSVNMFAVDTSGTVTVSNTSSSLTGVKFQIRAPSTQAANIWQVIKEITPGNNYTAFSVGATGALVVGDTGAPGSGITRFQIRQGSGQSVDLFNLLNSSATALITIDSNGKLIFTATAGAEPLRIVSGAGVGKVLTSDADGDASWQTVSSLLDDDLDAIAALTGTGILVRTADDTWALRTLVPPSEGITIANADGVSGNPTVALANDLLALEGLTGTGIARRTAADTWSVGTVVAISEGGTGQTTALAAFNALSPLTMRGDLLTRDATNNVRLAVGTVDQLLRADGTDAAWASFSDFASAEFLSSAFRILNAALPTQKLAFDFDGTGPSQTLTVQNLGDYTIAALNAGQVWSTEQTFLTDPTGLGGQFLLMDPTSGNRGQFDLRHLTGDRLIEWPDAAGRMALTSQIPTVDSARTWATLQKFEDTAFQIVDPTSPTNTLSFDITSTGTTRDLILSWPGTGDQTLTLPDATDTLIGKATTDVLLNKSHGTGTDDETLFELVSRAETSDGANRFLSVLDNSSIGGSPGSFRLIFRLPDGGLTADRFITFPDTQGIVAYGSGLVAGRVAFVAVTGALTTDADLTFSGSTLTATNIAAHGLTGNMTIANGINIVLNTGTGTKIGTGATQKLGFWNATPVAQDTGWSVSNVTTDRTYDANATSLDEIADVLGTLINQLKTYGFLGA